MIYALLFYPIYVYCVYARTRLYTVLVIGFLMDPILYTRILHAFPFAKVYLGRRGTCHNLALIFSCDVAWVDIWILARYGHNITY